MAEMICVHLGACGCAIGETFFNCLSREHNIGPDGKFYGKDCIYLDGLQVYYHRCHSSACARAICVDLDQKDLQCLRYAPYGRIFRPQNMICTNGDGSGNIYAKAYLTEGTILLEPCMEAIRREVEHIDAVHGFQVAHALGGGTGSGFGSLLFENLADEFPRKINTTISVLPSSRSESVVEPYNLVLSLPTLIASTHLNYCIDNNTIDDICKIQLCLGPLICFRDINFIISHTVAAYSACVRFPGQLNCGVRKLYTNLVPFPQMHCITPGFAPINSVNQINYEAHTTFQLMFKMFANYHSLTSLSLKDGKIISLAAVFRGLISPKQVDQWLSYFVQQHRENFVCAPQNTMTAICKMTPKAMPMAVSVAANASNVLHVFDGIVRQFKCMLDKNAFIHWYLKEGMEKSDFEQAYDEVFQWLCDYSDVMTDDLNESRGSENSSAS